ncbi:hypothetical protein ACIPXV_33020 [Streptomyces libani]|uniref:hypothetical protein n=1 Tax=Streptomyces nigrescens TaxID=1920 RepID=UPI003823A20E
MPLPAYDLTAAPRSSPARLGAPPTPCRQWGRYRPRHAALLAAAGATVHCADLDEQGAKATAAAITAAEGSAHAHRLDITRRDQVSTRRRR